MNRHYRQPWLKFLLATFFSFALQLFLSPPATATAKLIIGYATHNARIAPVWVAQEQGFFAKYGIDTEQVYVRAATILVAGLSSGEIQIGRSGGSATLSAVAVGHDFKIVATFSSRNPYDLVARPNVKKAEDLRGKKFGVTSIGGTTWMGALLWLEQLGLDPQRDQIQLQAIGDQNTQTQAIETGIVDAGVLDGTYSRRLRQKGFTILGEHADLKKPVLGQAMVVPRLFLQQRADIVENYLKAEIEALAFAFAPKNKPAMIRLLMRRLKTDAAGAEDGYADLVGGIERRPFPSLDGLRNIQRLMKIRSPKVGEVKAEDIIDGRIMQRLDESSFIERAYAAQGVNLK
jgi:ABC-type nitrate/sulfonate/bicarbonate transport system substrate-binding protein